MDISTVENLCLPSSYVYNFINVDFRSTTDFSSNFRIANIIDEKSAMEWVDSFQKISNVTWRLARTYKAHGRFNLFRKDFKCQHNTDSRFRTKNVKLTKNTNCSATMKVVIQRYYEQNNLKSPQDIVKKFPCLVELNSTHNHLTDSAAALRFKDISENTKEFLKHLFLQGHTASSASRSLDIKYQLENEDTYDLLVADSSVFPSISVIQHLFDAEFKKVYGAKTGESMLTDLESFCIRYSEGTGKAAMLRVADHIVVAVCTPIMLRTALLLHQAQELILVDASGNMDTLNHRIYFFVSTCVAGGAPIGCIITDVETQVVFESGVKLLKSLLPEGSILRERGPEVFMTDGDLKEINALHKMWPNSVYLLCQFHVLKAMWSWLCNSKHQVSISCRQELFFAFRDLMYAENGDKFEERKCWLSNLAALYKCQLFERYFQSLLANKSAWASYLRSGLPIRGNNTNNYVEVVFRILKDTVLNRVKAFSLIQLCDFLTMGYENYLHRRYLDFSLGKYTGSLLRRFISKGIDKVVADSITYDSEKGYFIVKLKDIDYLVDMRSSFCTCQKGCTGQLCVHIFLLAKHQNLASEYFYSETSRRIMYTIATGKELPSDNYLKPIDFNPHGKSPSSALCVDAVGYPIYAKSDIYKDNEIQATTSQTQDSSTDSALGEFDKLVERIKKGLVENPEVFQPAVLKMSQNAEKFAHTETALVSAMHNFAKHSGPRALSVSQSRRKGFSISVQPTAVARRKTSLAGKRRLQGGRAPAGARINALREHRYTPFVLPGSKKLPHNLSDCVYKNKGITKK